MKGGGEAPKVAATAFERASGENTPATYSVMFPAKYLPFVQICISTNRFKSAYSLNMFEFSRRKRGVRECTEGERNVFQSNRCKEKAVTRLDG
jgi:hypothetical protein